MATKDWIPAIPTTISITWKKGNKILDIFKTRKGFYVNVPRRDTAFFKTKSKALAYAKAYMRTH